MNTGTGMDLGSLDDHALIRHAHRRSGEERAHALHTLYRRYYDRVGLWALRQCGDPEEAAELAQEVFIRVQDRIDSFRFESAFSTWIWRVTRNLAIDRGVARARRAATPLDDAPEPRDPALPADDALGRREVVDRFVQAMERDLDPTERRVLYLHYVDGVQLADVTEALELTNASGAKAFIVSARRKLARHFGRWFDSQRATTARSAP